MSKTKPKTDAATRLRARWLAEARFILAQPKFYPGPVVAWATRCKVLLEEAGVKLED